MGQSGVTQRDVPSRHKWLALALPVLFGDEPVLTDPWPAIREFVAAFAAQSGAIRDRALHDAAVLDGIDSELLSVEDGLWAAWQEATGDGERGDLP